MSESEQIAEIQNAISEKRGWFIALGILLLVMGVISIASPLMATIVIKIFAGWMIIIAGIFEVVHAFSTRDWGGFFWNLIVGLLYVFVGGWLAFFPLTGIIALTVLLAVMFVGEGVMKLIMATGMDREDGRLWIVISGVAALIVGIMLFLGLPSTATWAIGLLIGINFIFSGWAFLAVSLFAKKADSSSA
ncbi:MAG: HdeD family acid-resistance protein [Rhizobiaceae bacterium]